MLILITKKKYYLTKKANMNSIKNLLSVAFLLLILLSACKKEEPETAICKLAPKAEERIFEFLHTTTGDTFLAWTSDLNTIQQVETQLALPQNQRGQHINGVILRLPEDCSINQQWSWYFEPSSWTLSDLSIELCDGNPQYVEENLEEYVSNIGRYCPWSSIVLRAVEQQ